MRCRTEACICTHHILALTLHFEFMRIYEPLNGLALLSEEPQVRETMVYAFFIHSHNVSLPAMAGQNSLKQMNSSHAFFFFLNADQRGNFGPGIKVFWGKDQRKPSNKEASLLNNKPNRLSLSKCVLAVLSFFSSCLFEM